MQSARNIAQKSLHILEIFNIQTLLLSQEILNKVFRVNPSIKLQNNIMTSETIVRSINTTHQQQSLLLRSSKSSWVIRIIHYLAFTNIFSGKHPPKYGDSKLGNEPQNMNGSNLLHSNHSNSQLLASASKGGISDKTILYTNILIRHHLGLQS